MNGSTHKDNQEEKEKEGEGIFHNTLFGLTFTAFARNKNIQNIKMR